MAEVIATMAVVARLDLAAAFALSTGAKLADPAGTRAALAAFGVAAPAVAARVLPAFEAGLAVALLAFPGHPAPAVAAAVTVAVFSLVVARRLRSAGPRVPCPCFGARGDSPASAATLWRNGALLALCLPAALPGEGAAAVPAAVAAAMTVPLVVVALRRTG